MIISNKEKGNKKMKDNYVILTEEYDESSKVTLVTINTPLGAFSGVTSPDEIDIQYPSRFHGNEIALGKALRTYASAAAAQLKREIKLLKSMIKQACDFAMDSGLLDIDIDNTSFRIMNGTLKQKQKELKKWEARIEGLTKNITNRIAARDKIVANYIKKDKKN